MRGLIVCISVIAARIALLCGIRKEVTQDNIFHAFPALSLKEQSRLLEKSYDNLATVFAEFLYLRFASTKKIIDSITFVNREEFDIAVQKGKGVIILSSHCANWEWMAIGGGPQISSSFSVVVKNIATKFTEKFLQRMRIRTGNKLINSGDVRSMFSILQRGEVLAMLGDQAAPSESVRVLFFHRLVPTFEGPARLALRTKSALLLAHPVRTKGGKYSVTFHSIDYSDLTEDQSNSIEVLTQRHTSLLEDCIRKNPDQWLWQHKRWKNA